MTTRLPLLTNSAAKTFRRCAREYELTYERGYRTATESEAVAFGTLIHLALEQWWLAPTGERLAPALAALSAERDPYVRAKAEALVMGYDARWSEEQYETLAVEREFTTALVNPDTGAASRTWDRGGKLDVIARHVPTGRVVIVEHKTTSTDFSPGSVYWERLTLDAQIGGYLVGARALGWEAEECLYDVLGRPGLRPSAVPLVDADGVKIVHDTLGARVRTKDGKKWRQTGDAEAGYYVQTRQETPDEYRERVAAAIAASPERYYQRGTVVRLGEDARDADYDTWQIGRSIREAQLAQRWPRNPESCERFQRLCHFWPVCSRTGSIDDPMLYRRAERAHEELTAAAEPTAAE